MSLFSELANTKVGEVEKPKPLPTGHYVARFTGQMKEHKAKSGNVAMRFPLRLVGPTDDVDAGELETAGGMPDKDFTIDFWMSPDARWRFTEFATSMGASDQLNLMECAEWLATEAGEFQIEVKHETSDDGKTTFMRLDSPAPLA